MPVFNASSKPPDWCELRRVEWIALRKGSPVDLAIGAPCDRLLVTSGQVLVRTDRGAQTLVQGQFIDLDPAETSEARLIPVIADSEILNFSGNWGSELGGCGIFSVVTDPDRVDVGDPVGYPKDTGFDCHYHDCDEYWIILEGRGAAVIEDMHFPVGPGDCVAIGRGFHHDFPQVSEPIRAAYFETTLEGLKRPGHLWAHTDGPASPDPGRR